VSPEDNERREAILRIAATRFSGPLPPPEALAKYNDILPGAADRIITMAEHQQVHRHQIEKMVIGSNATTQKVGVAAAFIIAMTAICGGIWLTSKGMSGSGLTTIIGALAALVGVFVYGKSEQKKQLQDQSDALTKSIEPPETPTHS
jgi:uncharacterized membrane protein